MSISEHSASAGPADVLVEVAARVAGLDDLLWSARSDDELVAVVEQVQALRAVLAAVEADAVAEAEVRQLAKTALHYGSTGDWLTHVGGLRRGEGRRLVRRAQALTGPLSATRARMVAGSVSPEQADVILRSVDLLPGGVDLRRKAETALLEQTRVLDATELTRTGRHLVAVVDPDGADRRPEAQLEREERASHDGRFLAITDDGAGGVRVKGRGSVEDGALLKAALLPLTCPRPAVDEHDGGGPVYDPRDHGARVWDALVQTAQHALDTEAVPDSHGTRPRLIVALDHDTLRGDGHGTTADGLDLPAAVIRRLACDADLVPAVLGTRGEVLDVGRARRLVTTAIWLALIIRDRHCAFPGCTRPPVMCHAHHIRHWADGGTTSLDNLVLLCGHHHRVTHHTPWEIRSATTHRRPEFSPPPRLGRARTWMRDRPRAAGARLTTAPPRQDPSCEGTAAGS